MLTKQQADVLNEAREVLDALAERFEAASWAIFEALNAASVFGGDEIAAANVHSKGVRTPQARGN